MYDKVPDALMWWRMKKNTWTCSTRMYGVYTIKVSVLVGPNLLVLRAEATGAINLQCK